MLIKIVFFILEDFSYINQKSNCIFTVYAVFTLLKAEIMDELLNLYSKKVIRGSDEFEMFKTFFNKDRYTIKFNTK